MQDEGRVLLIDKDLKWTSFDVVRKTRGILKTKKVGHAGTLDPLATGLLIICAGKKTKKINEYQDLEKEYTGTFTLGAVTPSFDMETEVSERFETSHIDEELIKKAAGKFTGTIEQVPPIYSAIQVDGVRLYKHARAGRKVNIEPRKVTVHEFEITDIDIPTVSFRVVCSKGTYIRSLASDFGKALDSGAYLSSLRRTRIGPYKVSEALTIDQLKAEESENT